MRLYFKGLWRALTGKVYTITFEEAYGNNSNCEAIDIDKYIHPDTILYYNNKAK